MTLRPVRSSRRGYRHRRARLSSQYSWKPWKGWNPSRTFNGNFDSRASIKIIALLAILASSYLGLDYSFGGPAFHNFSQTNPPHFVNPSQCQYYAPQLGKFETYTCGDVAGLDPTTPITRYTAPNNNLGEFNVAGNVAYSSSCGALSNVHGSTCMVLSATKAPPPLAVQFKLTTTVKTTGATLIPTSFSTVYKRVTAISSNNTFQFDVTGGHAQTGTYTLTTTTTTTLTFYGIQPTVTCNACSGQVFTGYSEVLTVPPGQNSIPITLVWTGVNLKCLCSIAESLTPIGDLSPVVAREFEESLFWQPVNNATLTVGGTDPSLSWGFFLTTNSTLWQTSNQTWTPFLDPTVALFVQINLFSAPHTYNVIVYVQQKPGETLSQESVTNGCPGGSAFMCLPFNHANTGSTPELTNLLLNFTGAGGGSGLGTTCPAAISQGSTGCSSLIQEQVSPPLINFGSNTALPTLAIAGQTYYAGFFLGAKQLGSAVRFCFDNGDGNANFACNTTVAFKQFYTIPGCTGSSMEIDYCIPTGCSGNNCVSTTTDSSGFFGSVWHSLTSIGSSVLSFTQPIWGPVAGLGGTLFNDLLGALEAAGSYMINTAFPALEGLVTTVLNTIGNLVWPNSNIGTLLFNFLADVLTLLTNTAFGIPAFFANFPSFFSNFVSWLKIVFPFLSPMFIIAGGVLSFALSMISTGISIFTVGTQLILFSYGFILMFSFIVFVGDDGIGGVLTYLGTAEALAFKILNLVAVMTNLGLDLVVHVISLVPKPFVQMSAGKIPRLPTLETNTRITFPRFDFAELRSGNMVSAWLLMVGFYLDVFYESANPALPGSLSSLVPATASAMQNLANLLPMFKIFVFISGGLVLFYLVMMPVQRLGVDLGVFEELGVGLGGRQGPGPSGIHIQAGKARFGAGKRIVEQKEAMKTESETRTEPELQKQQQESTEA